MTTENTLNTLTTTYRKALGEATSLQCSIEARLEDLTKGNTTTPINPLDLEDLNNAIMAYREAIKACRDNNIPADDMANAIGL